ncbi:subtilase-type protease inhibitor [Streptomyces sp. NPDC048479]|uniref:subtilase-type protease inhibitor n=1 Tax=Streptomyces sp. NPDC048479 TaxID=3154725 RepID=UPI003444E097
MRRSAAKIACIAGTVAGLVALTVGPAAASEPHSLYSPSAMVLTVGQGESAATATIERAATLTCTPTAGGTHPDAKAACADLERAHGQPALTLNDDSGRICPKIYAPVTVTADGVWKGTRVSYEQTFANSCVARSRVTHLFDF